MGRKMVNFFHERAIKAYNLAKRLEIAEKKLTVDKIAKMSEEELKHVEMFRKLFDAANDYFEKYYEPLSRKK